VSQRQRGARTLAPHGARLGDRSYKQMRVMVFESSYGRFNLSLNCVAFLELLIESWISISPRLKWESSYPPTGLEAPKKLGC